MTRSSVALLALLLAFPFAAGAAVLSGVMIYATDANGTPVGPFNPAEERNMPGQLWRTLVLGYEWYGLGIMPGLPPANSDEPVLNMPDFSISIPLVEGDNDFSMVGEAGGLTSTDPYTRFALNLYFDGILDHPGISVLFDRSGPLVGSSPVPNPSQVMYGLAVNPVDGVADSTYTSGADTISVVAASFVSPHVHKLDYDKVQKYRPEPTDPGSEGGTDTTLGGLDYLGVLILNVEGPSSAQPGGNVVGPGAFGIQPGTAVVGPDLLGAPGGRAPVLQPTQQGGTAPGAPAADAARSGEQIASGDTPGPTAPEGEQTPTPAGTGIAPTTPTAPGTPAARTTVTTPATTPTPGAAATAQATAAGLTATPQASRPASTPRPHAPTRKPHRKQ